MFCIKIIKISVKTQISFNIKIISFPMDPYLTAYALSVFVPIANCAFAPVACRATRVFISLKK